MDLSAGASTSAHDGGSSAFQPPAPRASPTAAGPADPVDPDPHRTIPVPASLARRPPLPAEAAATARPRTVCVTGATGYIGSRCVERLLGCGHAVHALVLPAEMEGGGAAHLQSLPGAPERLRLFPGDIRDAAAAGPQPPPPPPAAATHGSAPHPAQRGPAAGLPAALAGCAALLHLAAVVDLLPAGAGRQGLMVDTALAGTERVLDAAASTPGCGAVVLASSVAAVVADNWERGRGHVYSEADWAVDCAPGYNTYSFSKSRSERLALEWAARQPAGGLRVASVNPGVVFGPVAVARHALTSPGMIRGLLTGPALDLHAAFADVDDVAAALCAAAVDGRVAGRHLVASRCCGLHEVARSLAAGRPGWAPRLLHVPRWLVAAVPAPVWRLGGTDAAVVAATLGKPLAVDTARAAGALGLAQTLPFDDTIAACAQSLADLGLAPEYAAAGATAGRV